MDDINVIEEIVKEVSKRDKYVEFIILKDKNGNYSFQPNYTRLNPGDIDEMDNIVIKKISYYGKNN